MVTKQTSRLSHQERAKRRFEMAKLILEGKTLGDAAIKFGVAVATVREACREHGVRLPAISQSATSAA